MSTLYDWVIAMCKQNHNSYHFHITYIIYFGCCRYFVKRNKYRHTEEKIWKPNKSSFLYILIVFDSSKETELIKLLQSLLSINIAHFGNNIDCYSKYLLSMFFILFSFVIYWKQTDKNSWRWNEFTPDAIRYTYLFCSSVRTYRYMTLIV